jgi:hypothetical protein
MGGDEGQKKPPVFIGVGVDFGFSRIGNDFKAVVR